MNVIFRQGSYPQFQEKFTIPKVSFIILCFIHSLYLQRFQSGTSRAAPAPQPQESVKQSEKSVANSERITKWVAKFIKQKEDDRNIENPA